MRFFALLLTTAYAVDVQRLTPEGEWLGPVQPVNELDFCEGDPCVEGNCDFYAFQKAMGEFYEANFAEMNPMFAVKGQYYELMKAGLDAAKINGTVMLGPGCELPE